MTLPLNPEQYRASGALLHVTSLPSLTDAARRASMVLLAALDA
jgi:hypothetical protein